MLIMENLCFWRWYFVKTYKFYHFLTIFDQFYPVKFKILNDHSTSDMNLKQKIFCKDNKIVLISHFLYFFHKKSLYFNTQVFCACILRYTTGLKGQFLWNSPGISCMYIEIYYRSQRSMFLKASRSQRVKSKECFGKRRFRAFQNTPYFSFYLFRRKGKLKRWSGNK